LELADDGYVHAPAERLDEIPEHFQLVIEQTIGFPVVAKWLFGRSRSASGKATPRLENSN